MKTRYILFTIALLAVSAFARDAKSSESEDIATTIAASFEESASTKSTVLDGSSFQTGVWYNFYAIPETLSGGSVGQPVDLGLSVKWASWNVGASSPEEYGAYFAWGETEPSVNNNYDWPYYRWCDGSSNSLTKYNLNSSYGIVDNKTTLDLEDDAAHISWGGSWRMPTSAEFQELIDNCTAVWTTENGVNGRRFTSNIKGYTDKSIFIPAAGYRVGNYQGNSGLEAGSYGTCWSSTLNSGYPGTAHYLFISSGGVYVNGFFRYGGNSIRPVCE